MGVKCPKCGWQNQDNAAACSNCFQDLRPGQPPPQQPQQPQPPQPTQQGQPWQAQGQGPYVQQPYGAPPTQPVPDYLVWSILATLFCCVPFGIVAIIKAAEANSKKSAGDYYGALQAANAARTWVLVSAGLALAGGVIYAVVALIARASVLGTF